MVSMASVNHALTDVSHAHYRTLFRLVLLVTMDSYWTWSRICVLSDVSVDTSWTRDCVQSVIRHVEPVPMPLNVLVVWEVPIWTPTANVWPNVHLVSTVMPLVINVRHVMHHVPRVQMEVYMHALLVLMEHCSTKHHVMQHAQMVTIPIQVYARLVLMDVLLARMHWIVQLVQLGSSTTEPVLRDVTPTNLVTPYRRLVNHATKLVLVVRELHQLNVQPVLLVSFW